MNEWGSEIHLSNFSFFTSFLINVKETFVSIPVRSMLIHQLKLVFGYDYEVQWKSVKAGGESYLPTQSV